MGEFDIDNEGNNVICRHDNGNLIDKNGKRVNKRGYLIDDDKYVVTKKGVKVFRPEEVDSDDEIPAPFCFEKKKEALFKIDNYQNVEERLKKNQI